MRALVVFNPLSGKGGAVAASEAAESRLRAAGYDTHRLATRPGTGATEVVAELASQLDRVVVAGGDGTLRETVVGLGEHASRVAIALLPLGNANVVARELGVPLRTQSALELVAGEHTSELDVGEVSLEREDATRERELFLAMVGVGFDAHVVRGIARVRATRWGRFWYWLWADSVYVAAGLLAAFRRQPRDLLLRVEEVARADRYRAALLCNTRIYGKGWSAVPAARADDGRLDYQARKRSGLLSLIRHLLAARFQRPSPPRVSDHGSGERLDISCERLVAVEVDGDDRGDARRIEVALRPGRLRIVTPAPP